MPFKILCSCGVALLAGDDLESFKVACPECGNYTLLPSIPDPYKLPTNAEMIPVEEEEVVKPKKEKTGTVRKRGGAPRGYVGGSRGPEGEMSNTNVILIVALVIIVFVIIVVGAASAL